MIEFACDQCGERMAVPVSEAGRAAECPTCQLLQKAPPSPEPVKASRQAPAAIPAAPAPPKYRLADIMACLAVAAGGLLAACGLLVFLYGTSQSKSSKDTMDYIAAVITIAEGIACVIAGITWVLAGACAGCLRDMAINSWWVRQHLTMGSKP